MMNRSAHISWLLDELDELVTAGVMPGETADRIREHYGTPVDGTSVSLRSVFFAVLGSLLIGGGIILLIAHNWSEFGRGSRTVLALAPLILAQMLTFWVLRQRATQTAWREGVGIGLTLMLAASLALIGQTYQVPGDLYGFLGTWMLLTLPLLYVLDSLGTAIFYLVGIVWWTLAAPDHASSALYFLFLAAAIPYLLKRRHALLDWLVAIGVVIVWIPVTSEVAEDHWVSSFALLFSSMALMPGEKQWWRAPIRGVGMVGLVGWALLVTVSGVWDDAIYEAVPWLVRLTALLIVIAQVVITIMRCRARSERCWVDLVVMVFSPLVMISWLWSQSAGLFPWPLLFTLYVAALGLTMMMDGFQRTDTTRASGGLAILTLLVLTRFIDSDLSLIVRGLAFVVVGLGFLVANHLLNRRLNRRGETS
ncbi:MAG: DUF2157 domain-containing protein [Acidobacteriota bacterium]